MNELSVEARILAHQVGIFSMFKQVELQGLLEHNTTDGNYVGTRERMCDAWFDYKQALPRLRYSFGDAVKFFISPIWHDQSLWPWKEPQRFEPGIQKQAPQAVEPMEADELVKVNAWRAQRGLDPLRA